MHDRFLGDVKTPMREAVLRGGPFFGSLRVQSLARLRSLLPVLVLGLYPAMAQAPPRVGHKAVGKPYPAGDLLPPEGSKRVAELFCCS
jgi:hypothetical protein